MNSWEGDEESTDEAETAVPLLVRPWGGFRIRSFSNLKRSWTRPSALAPAPGLSEESPVEEGNLGRSSLDESLSWRRILLESSLSLAA